MGHLKSFVTVSIALTSGLHTGSYYTHMISFCFTFADPRPPYSFQCGRPAVLPCLPTPSNNSQCADRTAPQYALLNSYPWQVRYTGNQGRAKRQAWLAVTLYIRISQRYRSFLLLGKFPEKIWYYLVTLLAVCDSLSTNPSQVR